MVVFVRQLHHKNEEGILLMENVTAEVSRLVLEKVPSEGS